MPPKRKGAPTSVAEPLTKRVTRSRAIAAPHPAPEKPVRATTRRKRDAKPVVEVKTNDSNNEEYLSEGNEFPTEPVRVTRSGAVARGRVAIRSQSRAAHRAVTQPVEPQPLRKRGRPPGVRNLSKQDLPTKPSPATSSKVTIEALEESGDSEPDELLLRSNIMTNSARLTTPPRPVETAIVAVTPRMILDAVEVPTPSRMREGQNVISPQVAPSTKPSASLIKRFPQRETTPTRPTAHPLSPFKQQILQHTPHVAVPSSSIKEVPVTPTKSPRKGKEIILSQGSPSRLPHSLPTHLHASLEAQKRTVLKALNKISVLPHERSEETSDVEPPTNAVAFDQLSSLMIGTVRRGEGNSCLIVGPKGSGKTQLVERAIASLPNSPITIRLSGHAQTNDRLAIREIAWQLAEQTGQSLLPTENDDTAQDENPFLQTNNDTVVALPPPSHLLALISMLPTLPRATLIILDAFDLFALHARQSLLYCLLDTVQSCRAVSGNKGIAIIGVTTRVETLNILEKRVKSRFSGRIIRTAGHPQLANWLDTAKRALCSPISESDEESWAAMWNNSVTKFLQDQQVIGILKETYSLTKDVRVLSRLLVSTVANLKSSNPALSVSELTAAANSQRCPQRFSFLNSLTYPCLCLLIAASHARTSGHETFTFEMLHETFRDQVRISLSAPVTVDGGGIGMVRCSRGVLFGAFEKLVSLRVFAATISTAAGTGKEFMKYRCDIDKAEVKIAVDKTGQLNLKKWMNKAQ